MTNRSRSSTRQHARVGVEQGLNHARTALAGGGSRMSGPAVRGARSAVSQLRMSASTMNESVGRSVRVKQPQTVVMSDETYDGPGKRSELSLIREGDVFYLLSHHRKRIVLLLLAAAPHSRVHLQQVAQTLTALEEDCTLDRVETSEVRNRRRNLKRSHLGPLVEAGVIQEGDGSDVYRPGSAFSAALAVLLKGGYSLGR